MQIGLNLFSVRNDVQTEETFMETAKKIKEMGYDTLQLSGCPYNPALARREVEEVGLPISLTHVPFDDLENNVDRMVEEHLSFGCKNIGIGGYDWELFLSDEKMKALVARLEVVGQKIADKGLKFYYHNHFHEFIKMQRGTPFYYYLIENAPHVNLTLDTRWVATAGYDLEEVLNKACGRLECVHLRDFTVRPKRNEQNAVDFYMDDCAVGSGNIRFDKCIPQMKKLGTKHFIVEDTAFRRANTWEEIEKSLRYIKENFGE